MNYRELPMRVAVGQVRELTDEIILYTKQMGIQDLQFNFFHGSPHVPGETHWEYMDLLRLHTRCEDAGLRLNSIENVPIKFYDKVIELYRKEGILIPKLKGRIHHQWHNPYRIMRMSWRKPLVLVEFWRQIFGCTMSFYWLMAAR